MNILDQEARQLASYINQPIVELLETVFMRTRQDALEAMVVTSDEAALRDLKGQAKALKDAACVFREAYEISEAQARKAPR